MSPNGQALDVIAEVGPGYQFLGCAHTQKNFNPPVYQSNVLDNNSYEQWSKTVRLQRKIVQSKSI